MQSPKILAGTFASGSPSQVRCSVFCSASSPRRFFVDDRRSHEHNASRIRFDHSTVWFRFGRTGQEPPETQLRLTIAREMSAFSNLDLRKLDKEMTRLPVKQVA